MIRVMLVDDQELIRRAVAGLVAAEDGMEVAGQASDGEEAVALALELTPDVVVMDVRMPRLDGVAATASITADPRLAGVKVLVLTTFEDDATVLDALRAGASGFIGKGVPANDLLQAIRTVHEGDALLSPTATRALIARALGAAPANTDDADHSERTPGKRERSSRTAAKMANPAESPGKQNLPEVNVVLRQLTAREAEVVALVGRGLSNREIALRLFITEATAKTHVNRAMTKLGAHDRAQLVIAAYEAGLAGVDGDGLPRSQ